MPFNLVWWICICKFAFTETTFRGVCESTISSSVWLEQTMRLTDKHERDSFPVALMCCTWLGLNTIACCNLDHILLICGVKVS